MLLGFVNHPSYNVKPKIVDFSDFFKLFYLIKQS